MALTARLGFAGGDHNRNNYTKKDGEKNAGNDYTEKAGEESFVTGEQTSTTGEQTSATFADYAAPGSDYPDIDTFLLVATELGLIQAAATVLQQSGEHGHPACCLPLIPPSLPQERVDLAGTAEARLEGDFLDTNVVTEKFGAKADFDKRFNTKVDFIKSDLYTDLVKLKPRKWAWWGEEHREVWDEVWGEATEDDWRRKAAQLISKSARSTARPS